MTGLLVTAWLSGFEAVQRRRAVGHHAVGNRRDIDLAAAAARGAVTDTSGVLDEASADLCVGLAAAAEPDVRSRRPTTWRTR